MQNVAVVDRFYIYRRPDLVTDLLAELIQGFVTDPVGQGYAGNPSRLRARNVRVAGLKKIKFGNIRRQILWTAFYCSTMLTRIMSQRLENVDMDVQQQTQDQGI